MGALRLPRLPLTARPLSRSGALVLPLLPLTVRPLSRSGALVAAQEPAASHHLPGVNLVGEAIGAFEIYAIAPGKADSVG